MGKSFPAVLALIGICRGFCQLRIHFGAVFLAVASVAVLAGLVWISDFQLVASALKNSDAGLVAAGVFAYALAQSVRAYRLRLLMAAMHARVPGFLDVLASFYAVSLVNNFAPMRSGELVAPFILKRCFGIPRRIGFSATLFGRFVDLFLFLVIVIGTLVLASFSFSLGLSVGILGVSALLVLFLLALLALVLFSRRFLSSILEWVSSFSLVKNFVLLEGAASKALLVVEDFFSVVSKLHSREVLFGAVALGAFAWALEFLSLYLVVVSILNLGFAETVVAQVFSIAAGLASMLPLGVGGGALGFVAAAVIQGAALSNATASAVVAVFFLTGSNVFLGLISSAHLGINLLANKAK